MENFVRNNDQICPGHENLTVVHTKIPSLIFLNEPTFFGSTLNKGQCFASLHDRIFNLSRVYIICTSAAGLPPKQGISKLVLVSFLCRIALPTAAELLVKEEQRSLIELFIFDGIL